VSVTPNESHTVTNFSTRILEQVLKLRAADALDMQAKADVKGLYTWCFRAGGWPIEVHLDETVVEMRVYHGRHTISTGRVPPRLFPALIGTAELPAGSGNGVSADESLSALRAIVADWKRKNPRVFMEPPRTARHPDGWNNA
jgi:hypothetical protein